MAKLKYRELTYRTRPEDPRYFGEMAERLIGRRVVLWVPREDGYRRAWLISTNYLKDSFVIRWRRREPKLRLRGLWRIHNPGLFTDIGLPEPRGPAIVVEETITQIPKEGTAVATTSKRGSKAKAPAKASDNGGRSRDILEEYTEAERKRLAKAILKMKKAGAPWGEIAEELDLPGERPSVAGRRLLREYTDDGEAVIRQRNTSTKAKSKKRAQDEDDEEDDDEDEAPPKRRTRRTVTTKRASRKSP